MRSSLVTVLLLAGMFSASCTDAAPVAEPKVPTPAESPAAAAAKLSLTYFTMPG